MKINHRNSTLEVTIERNFNLAAIRELDQHVDETTENLIINLKHSFFIDSEAIIFMHRWMESGKKLTLRNPPDILYEILDALGLSDSWDLEEIIEVRGMTDEF